LPGSREGYHPPQAGRAWPAPPPGEALGAQVAVFDWRLTSRPRPAAPLPAGHACPAGSRHLGQANSRRQPPPRPAQGPGSEPATLQESELAGRSPADARCYLVLSDRALVVVVKARRSGAMLRFIFEDLAYFGPAVGFSGKRIRSVDAHGRTARVVWRSRSKTRGAASRSSRCWRRQCEPSGPTC
jgi:hypothetical protein